jgi:SAM-dependent MidA family methyltransferase
MVKSSSPSKKISAEIRERGPLTVAAFMELALYDAEIGYYARTPRRSGRAGDFFTSVDVGPLFGQLLAVQLAEMFTILASRVPNPESQIPNPKFDLVEAGAADGRLAADILRAAQTRHPSLYAGMRLHLVEASPAAREAQRQTLGDAGERLASSSPHLPASFEGVLIANELLDALPVHHVVMREEGLREVYVDVAPDAQLTTREGQPSTPALEDYLTRAGVTLEPGWRAEINLQAVEWIREAARRLRRGFIILIDYGHDARELYSLSHAQGTLTTFARHTTKGPESAALPAWLEQPGEQDITAHVDFTSVRAAAEAEGLQTCGFLDQTYFLLGILTGCRESFVPSVQGGREPVRLEGSRPPSQRPPSRHLKTLLMPGGLGSTHKVLILGKGVGTPALVGCSYRQRIT